MKQPTFRPRKPKSVSFKDGLFKLLQNANRRFKDGLFKLLQNANRRFKDGLFMVLHTEYRLRKAENKTYHIRRHYL